MKPLDHASIGNITLILAPKNEIFWSTKDLQFLINNAHTNAEGYVQKAHYLGVNILQKDLKEALEIIEKCSRNVSLSPSPLVKFKLLTAVKRTIPLYLAVEFLNEK